MYYVVSVLKGHREVAPPMVTGNLEEACFAASERHLCGIPTIVRKDSKENGMFICTTGRQETLVRGKKPRGDGLFGGKWMLS